MARIPVSAICTAQTSLFTGRIAKREVPYEGSGQASGGPFVTGHYPQDRLNVIGWVAGEFEGNGHVSGSSGDDELVEVTVTDDGCGSSGGRV